MNILYISTRSAAESVAVQRAFSKEGVKWDGGYKRLFGVSFIDCQYLSVHLDHNFNSVFGVLSAGAYIELTENKVKSFEARDILQNCFNKRVGVQDYIIVGPTKIKLSQPARKIRRAPAHLFYDLSKLIHP